MNIDSATFELLAEPPVPEWIIRVEVTGSGFEVRALPFMARVGDIPVEGLHARDDGTLLVGHLRAVPTDGDHLFVGYADHDLIDTGVAFQTPPIV